MPAAANHPRMQRREDPVGFAAAAAKMCGAPLLALAYLASSKSLHSEIRTLTLSLRLCTWFFLTSNSCFQNSSSSSSS